MTKINYKITERKGKDEELQTYTWTENDICVERNSSTKLVKATASKFKEVFLPIGYPYTVSDDYLQYQIWDSLQAYCSHLSGALSLHSTLKGLGVGAENASALAATFHWLIQDGAGMVSSISFAYWKGSHLDNNSKQWRLFADVANDATHLLKLLAPILPIPFIVTLCLSSIFLSLVGVTGGATRASLIQHQAQCDNMGDVAAKDGSQETMVNLAGLITSLTLISWITVNPILTWSAFLLCVVLHLFCNYKAMRSLKMKVLNRPRLINVLTHYIMMGEILTIDEANLSEPLFTGPAFKSDYLLPSWSVKLGSSISNFINCDLRAKTNFKRYFKEQEINGTSDKYYILANNNRKEIYVVYDETASYYDHLLSFWVSYHYAISCTRTNESDDSPELCDLPLIIRTKQEAAEAFPVFLSKLKEKGWLTTPLRLNVNEYVISTSKED